MIERTVSGTTTVSEAHGTVAVPAVTYESILVSEQDAPVDYRKPSPALRQSPVAHFFPFLPQRLSGTGTDRLVVLPDAGAPGDDADQNVVIVRVELPVGMPGHDHASPDHLPYLDRSIEKDAPNTVSAHGDCSQKTSGIRGRTPLAGDGLWSPPDAARRRRAARRVAGFADGSPVRPRRQAPSRQVHDRQRWRYLDHPGQTSNLVRCSRRVCLEDTDGGSLVMA